MAPGRGRLNSVNVSSNSVEMCHCRCLFREQRAPWQRPCPAERSRRAFAHGTEMARNARAGEA
jgi:hypothetical protein